jgi:hypothetical protein
LKSGKVFTPKRSAAAADEILKSKESSAHNEDNQQMTSAQRAQAFALNPKITNSLTEAESKDRKRNNNENYQLFRQRNDGFDPERVGPSTR